MYRYTQSEGKHIVITGRRNVGKLSLIRALIGQDISDNGDKTEPSTEPVQRIMDLPPYGPVILINTPDIDTDGELGSKRISETIKAIAGADFVIVVIDAQECLYSEEKELFRYLEKLSIPFLIAVNKIEFGVNADLLKEIKKMKKIHFEVSFKENVGITELKTKITRLLPEYNQPQLIENIVNPGDVVVFVVPFEKDTPEGKFILSQVQTIREALNENIRVVMVNDRELTSALNNLKIGPKLVVTYSQAIMKVAAQVPNHINLTTFSILMAKSKGELSLFIRGIKRIEELKDGDRVLIAEACTQHFQGNNIGRNKISQWLQLCVNKELHIEVRFGDDFPENLDEYKLIVHCDGYMISRYNMQSRIQLAKLFGVPIVNFSVLISYMQGAFPRAILPFEEAVFEWKRKSSPAYLQL